MDALGLLPPNIKQRLEREDRHEKARAFVPVANALKSIDPHLSLRRVNERTPSNRADVKPGYWHVVRQNPPPLSPSFMPITTATGGFREPDFGVVEEVKTRDRWAASEAGHRRRLEKWIDKAAPVKDPSAKRPVTLDEGMVDDLKDDLRAGARVAGDGGITKRKWGKK